MFELKVYSNLTVRLIIYKTEKDLYILRMKRNSKYYMFKFMYIVIMYNVHALIPCFTCILRNDGFRGWIKYITFF